MNTAASAGMHEGLEIFEVAGEYPLPGTSARAPLNRNKKPKDDSTDDGGFTTVMLRNIPNKYTRKMLIDQLHGAGFKGDIDYLYLPTDFGNRCNVGYCFVNFRTSAARQRFSRVFDGVAAQSCLPGFNSQKVCQVTRAKLQGREENLRRLRGSSELMAQLAQHPDWLPLLLTEQGMEEPFSGEPGGVSAHRGAAPRRQSRKGDGRQQLPQYPTLGLGELIDGFPGARGGGGKGAGRRQRRGGGRGQPPQMPGLAAYPGPAGGRGGWGDMPMMLGMPVAPGQGLQYMPPYDQYENGYYPAYQPMAQGGQFYGMPYMQPYEPGYLSGWWGHQGGGQEGGDGEGQDDEDTPEEM